MHIPWISSRTEAVLLVAVSAYLAAYGFVTGETVSFVFVILGLSGAHKAYVAGANNRLPNALYRVVI